MKPHPRIRKTIKWGGAAVAVLLMVVWIVSRGYFHEWLWSHDVLTDRTVSVGDGYVNIGQEKARMLDMDPPPPGGGVVPDPSHFGLWFEWVVGPPMFKKPSSRAWRFSIPIWTPAVVPLVMAIVAWRLDSLARRRALLNLCPKCNYDRTGIAAVAACPECGNPPT